MPDTENVPPEEQGLARRIQMATTGWECSCTPYPAGDGPEIDCPVHGIQVGVIKDLVAEVQRFRNVLGRICQESVGDDPAGMIAAGALLPQPGGREIHG